MGLINCEYFKNTGFGLNLSCEILAIYYLSITENGEHGKEAQFEITVPSGAFRLTHAK
ncbi:MAG: hypothetical protein Q7V05_08565 [Methanoregula sp.]|nr:hypothetical protein [Methanoregula sp.]